MILQVYISQNETTSPSPALNRAENVGDPNFLHPSSKNLFRQQPKQEVKNTILKLVCTDVEVV